MESATDPIVGKLPLIEIISPSRYEGRSVSSEVVAGGAVGGTGCTSGISSWGPDRLATDTESSAANTTTPMTANSFLFFLAGFVVKGSS